MSLDDESTIEGIPRAKDTIPDASLMQIGRKPDANRTQTGRNQSLPQLVDWRELWPQFIRACEVGLEIGEQQYGDSTFHRPAQEVAAELECEVRDQAVYAFIAWCRIRRLRDRLRDLEEIR